VWFLKGVKLVKLDWVTKRAVARHMTRGATDAESGVKDCLKQRPMSRNLELRGRITPQAPRQRITKGPR
jgi:hypothetical protein